jgi:hypothetical protein
VAVLFNITHDANNLDEYDSVVDDGGDLATGTPGLAGTTAKMEATIDDTASIYGQKNQSAPASNEIRLRFYVDPHSLSMGHADHFCLCRSSIGATDLISVWLYYSDTFGYRIYSFFYDDDGLLDSVLTDITDAEHYVEFHIERASSDVASDGRQRLWVDGEIIHTEDDVDNYDKFGSITYWRLGAVVGLDEGTSGTLYLDEFKANDDGSEIGPVAGIAGPLVGRVPVGSLVHGGLV